MGSSLIKLNNRGASLIMVVIGLACVLAFGTIAVSAAITNYQTKYVDSKAKTNYYSAEAALDEIKTGLSEDMGKALSKAYHNIFTKYSVQNDAMRRNLFRTTLTQEMMNSLGVSVGTTDIPLSRINAYLKETKKSAPGMDGAEVIAVSSLDTTSSEDYIAIRGLKISYSRGQYCTYLTTDIKLMIPGDYTGNIPSIEYADYSLIGDEGIRAEFSDTLISGNLYAGSKGLQTGFGKTMTISGSRIIAKGDIRVKDTGGLIISGSDTEIWAGNLLTTQTNKESAASEETYISIDGKCYIKDDLAVEAKKSRIFLTGEYYGYSAGNAAGESSAVIINATDADVNLSGLSKLYLAGRAQISLQDGAGVVSYHKDEAYGAIEGANCNIQTGESIVLKGSQNVYLLAGEYLAPGHNPVSWSEYTAGYDVATHTDTLIQIPTDALVFAGADIPVEEQKLLYYLDSDQPVKKAFYKFGANDNVVYYYLNFKSQEMATTYFKNFMKCYPEKIYNGFPVRSIKINRSPGAYCTAGNIMLYDSALSLLRGTNGDFTNHYGREFQNLTATLHKNRRGNTNPGENSVFEYILDLNQIRSDALGLADGIIMERDFTIGEASYYVCIVNNETEGSYHFRSSGKKGIIIATGDVSMERNFEGLVLSNGTIEINASTVTAAPNIVHLILNQIPEVAKYFNAYKDVTESGYINPAKLITYENWSKN